MIVDCLSVQEEGWLFGRIESTGVKGVFPENFTKRLE